jgi:hypothetical protein
MSRHRTRAAEANVGITDGNHVESGYEAQINQHARRGQAKGKDRHQALAAGDHDRIRISGE